MSFKNLLIRTLTGSVYLLVLVSAILYNRFSMAFLFLVILTLAINETNRMIAIPEINPQLLTGNIMAKLTYLLPVGYLLGYYSASWILMVLIVLIIIPIIELYRKNPNPMANIAYTILPSLYISLPLAMLFSIAFYRGVYQPHLVLGLFVIIWIYDSGAYLIGSLIGKHKLFQRVSPNKTWEGAIGGGVAALAGSAFLLADYIPVLTQIQWIFGALIIVVFGTYGDLMESQLKRSAGVKDSGYILPGHGGILDRFDSALTASVAFWLYLQFI
jgi:phosphatidate cytidylyltransferase